MSSMRTSLATTTTAISPPLLEMLPSKRLSLESPIIGWYHCDERSIEIYLAGKFIQRIEGITEAAWSIKVSPSPTSELRKGGIYLHVGLEVPAFAEMDTICMFMWIGSTCAATGA